VAIEYVEGDLLGNGESIIIHGCNAAGGFDTGVAGAIRKKYPNAFREYNNHFQQKSLILGSVIWAVDNGCIIGNAITQPTYGSRTKQHVSYEAISSCMEAIAFASENGIPGTQFRNGFDRIAMPLIGSTRGGGDWNIIEEIIQEKLAKLNIVAYVLPGNKPSATELSRRPHR
jgi:O-acetyl-ADP-ribose deacetylase (regulator of RNase III)